MIDFTKQVQQNSHVCRKLDDKKYIQTNIKYIKFKKVTCFNLWKFLDMVKSIVLLLLLKLNVDYLKSWYGRIEEFDESFQVLIWRELEKLESFKSGYDENFKTLQ